MKRFFRKFHRWLGLLMALQIVAWMASGLYFSIYPIEVIRGEHLTQVPPAPAADQLRGLVAPAEAWASVTKALPAPHELEDISLQQRDGALWYRVSGRADEAPFTRLVHGESGQVAGAMSGEQVRALAGAALTVAGEVDSVEWVEAVEPGSEIRGRQLPVWAVNFSRPESLTLYFEPWTGDLLARRTARWRLFDFFWMLHIMDFDTRDDFNTPLLQASAALGLLVALSGVIFWLLTTRVLRSRRVGGN